MADRYWVGGTGTWSSTNTTNWSTSSGGAGGASVPTSADNVFFNVNSNVGTGAFTVTMADTPRVCNDFTASGLDGTMTLAGTSIGLTVSGSLSFPATNFTRTYTGTTTFNATTTGKTITTNGVAFGGAVTLNGVGGAWTLGSAFSCGTIDLTLINGTFDTSVSNYAVTAGGFSSSNSNTRTINLNSSTITLSGTSAWTMTTSTNATLNAGTSTITLTSLIPTFSGGGLTYYNLTTTFGSGGAFTINQNNTFNNVALQASILQQIVVLAGNQIINGTFTFNGSNGINRGFIRSNFIGTSRTLTCAAIAAMTDVDFRDITIAGAHGTLSGTRLGDCGGNSNITFVAGANKYWNLAAGGNWNSTAWALSSGGAVAAANFPLAQDTVIIENTGLNTSTTVTINTSYNIGTLDTSTRTNAMTLASSTFSPTFYGNFTYGSGVTPTGTGTYQFSNRSTKTLNSGGKTFTQQVAINAPGGGIQLITNNLTLGSALTTFLGIGTLDLNNLILSTGRFDGTGSNIRAIAFGTGNITCTGTGTVWDTQTFTNLTTTGTQVVNVTSIGSAAITVLPGGLPEADAISFNFTGGTYTLNNLFAFSTYSVRNLNFTGFAGTLAAIAGGVVYGNLTISTGMTIASANATLNFRATSGTQLITTNGKTLDFNITFNGVGGTFRLEDALTIGATRAATLTNGTLNLNGKTCTVGARFTTATGTKNLTFNGGTLVCPDPNTTSFNNAAPTNFTTTAGTGTGTISMTAATAKTFIGGGSTYNCTLNQGGAGTLTITGANTFNDIANTNATASQIRFPASTTTTVNNFTLSGSAGNLVSIRSSTGGTRFTLSKSSSTVNVSYVDIQDSNATGGATWRALTSNGNVDSGNNLGWVFFAGTYVDASADVTADATVAGSALRVRLFAGDVSAAAAISAIAFRARLFAGDISSNASVEGQAVRVRVASGDITGNAIVTGIGNITAGGAANISGFAEVSAYGSATYSFNALVTANANVIANGQIIGEEWGDAATTSSTWTDTTPASSTWQPASQSSNTWLRQ